MMTSSRNVELKTECDICLFAICYKISLVVIFYCQEFLAFLLDGLHEDLNRYIIFFCDVAPWKLNNNLITESHKTCLLIYLLIYY